MRPLVAAMLLALVLSSCSTGTDLDVSTDAAPDPVAGDDTDAPVADPSPDEPEPPPPDEPEPPPDDPEPEPPPPEEPEPLTIPVGPPELLGAALGSDDDEAIATLTAVLGPGVDTGWSEGCPLNEVDERTVSWGGLRADFEATPDGTEFFARWAYELDPLSVTAIPGGPTPDQIVLPGGVQLGDPFSSAATAYGFSPFVDETFGVAYYFADDFSIRTYDPGVDSPITFVGVPDFYFCD